MKKNPIAENAKEIKSEIKSAISLNLEKYADQLSGMQLKEKKIRETIYIYPEGWDKSKISSEDGKKFRNSLRNQLRRFSNNILIYCKMKDQEKLSSEIKSFLQFYKEKFRNNDLSLGSISQSNDPIKEKDFSLFLQIVKECK